MPAKAKPKRNLSAMKRARQAVKRNLRNKTVQSRVKTIIKKVESAIASGSKEDANKALTAAIKVINKASSKGVIHRNTASRKISRLTKKVNALPLEADLPPKAAIPEPGAA